MEGLPDWVRSVFGAWRGSILGLGSLPRGGSVGRDPFQSAVRRFGILSVRSPGTHDRLGTISAECRHDGGVPACRTVALEPFQGGFLI